MLFYFITILIGIVLDFVNQKNNATKLFRKIFVVWLFIFLCFGYTVGSDWRGYEIEFGYLNGRQDMRWTIEVGFGFLFLLCKKFFVDYWLSVGILKCMYLYTLIRVVKKITVNWLSVIVFLITGSLGFVLIDNPLRFMTALVLVNVAMELIIDKKFIWATLLLVLSFFFHNASLFFAVLLPLFLVANKLEKTSRILLITVYLVVFIISSSGQYIESLRQQMIQLALLVFSDIRSFSAYEVVSNRSFFTIGSLINLIFFLVVIYTRDFITKQYEKGSLIYGMTVFYLILSRLFMIIPTGFRLVIPLSVFYMAYFVLLIRSKHIMSLIFIAYLCFTFPRDLTTTYKYIPYTNSIPYILTGHMSYDERYWYNINAYEERTGKQYNGDF